MNWELYRAAVWTELWQPSILLQSLGLQVLYLLFVVGPWRKVFPHARKPSAKEIIIFFMGAWVFFFTFGSPLDYTSDHFLFSAHMVQHLLEILCMTPILMKGVPDYVYLALFHIKGISKMMYRWTKPMVAVIVFNVTFTAFHIPFLYDLTLQFEWFHFIEHLFFFICAFFLWWPLLGIIPEIHTVKTTKKMGYLFYASMLSMPIDTILFFSSTPWYQDYVAAPRLITGLTAMGDQQLGAIIMFAGMVAIFGSLFIATYLQYDNSEWYE